VYSGIGTDNKVLRLKYKTMISGSSPWGEVTITQTSSMN
jgi:hypothetical protein